MAPFGILWKNKSFRTVAHFVHQRPVAEAYQCRDDIRNNSVAAFPHPSGQHQVFFSGSNTFQTPINFWKNFGWLRESHIRMPLAVGTRFTQLHHRNEGENIMIFPEIRCCFACVRARKKDLRSICIAGSVANCRFLFEKGVQIGLQVAPSLPS